MEDIKVKEKNDPKVLPRLLFLTKLPERKKTKGIKSAPLDPIRKRKAKSWFIFRESPHPKSAKENTKKLKTNNFLISITLHRRI